MKRGLKAVCTFEKKKRPGSSNLCPDEKGTESTFLLSIRQLLDSSNLCPDEKGTERVYWYLNHNCNIQSSNLCPDEKGTESTGKPSIPFLHFV